MKKLKFLTLAVLPLVLALGGTPAFAQTYTGGASGSTSGSIAVSAVVSSTYSIELPASLVLAETDADTHTFSSTYSVGVKANLLDNEKVTVIPDASFTMTSGVHNATASVSQPINTWRNTAVAGNEIAADFEDFVPTTGTISVVLTNAGTYNGSATFTFTKTTDS